MKGIVRKLDNLGRATLPVEIRRSLGFKENEKVDIYISGKTICIESATRCFCCKEDEKDELIEYKDSYLCKKCLRGFIEESKW